MSELRVIGSSSRGNSYAIICKDETLLLECGVRFKETLDAINYEIEKVVGVLCSHR